MLKTILAAIVVVVLAGSFFTVLYLISSDEEELRPALFFEGLGAEQSFVNLTGKSTALSAVNPPPESGSEFDWTIVGSIFDPVEKLDSLAWWEPVDGNLNDWELKQPLIISDTSQKFEALATLPDLQVAVGSEGRGLNSSGFAWYRTEPGEWLEANSRSLEGVNELLAVDISPFKEVIAIGRRTEAGKQVYELWFSRDAVEYKKIELLFPEGTVLNDVAAGTAGFVAVGTRERSDGISEGIVRVSRDGINWDEPQSPVFNSDQNVILSGVAASDQGYVIVGGIHDGSSYSPSAWVAQNITSWTQEGIFFDEGRLDNRISSAGHFARGVATTSDGFVAFSDIDFLQQIWRSRDGRAWGEVGYIRGHRDTGVPVQDAALTYAQDSNTIAAVAIASDTGIWIYTSDSSWAELNFDIEKASVLYRIEDGPEIYDVVWNPAGEEFIAAGAFSHAEGEGSEITVGGRFWRSGDLGATWEFQDQFHRQELGGPVFDLDAGASGIAAAGSQDMKLTFAAAEGNPEINPNPSGLFWKLDENRRWEQFIPIPLPAPAVEDFPVSGNFFAVTSTPDGFIMGGWSFYGSDSTVDGLIYIYSKSDDGVHKLVDRREIGLAEEQDDIVTALCTKLDEDSNEGGYSTVLFGIISKSTGTRIGSAVSSDGGISWSIGTSSDNSFDEFANQEVNSCASVSSEICGNTGSIFENLAPCSQSEDFYIAVGRASIRGELNARAWWSINGRNWELINLPESLSGPGNQSFVEVLTSESGILIIGNDDSTGINLGQLWIEQDGKLVELETGFEDSRVAVNFFSGAVNPNGNVVLVGTEDSRLPRIWHSREPILKSGVRFKTVVESN